MEPLWRNSYPPYIPDEINPSATPTVIKMLERAFSEFADRPAFFNRDEAISYRQLDALSLQFATYLQGGVGRRKGDRVALMCPNILPFPVAMCGILRAGLAQVSVNPFYKPRELKHQLNDAHVETIVIAESALPTLLEVIRDTPVNNVILIGFDDLLPSTAAAQAQGDLDDFPVNVVRFTDALEAGKNLKFKPITVEPDNLAFLQYTGGTTGLSKGAMLNHGNIVAQVLGFTSFMGPNLVEGEEIIITASPMYHILGLGVNCLGYMSVGGEVVLIENPRDMKGMVALLKRFPFTAMTGVNTLYNNLLHTEGVEDVDFSHLKLALGGGTPIQEAISVRWKSVTGNHIKEGYGMSEAGGLTMNPLHINEFKHSIGLPYPSVEISLRDDNDREVGLNEPGELCVRGPMVMQGYWGIEDNNHEIFSEDGFFRSGDIAKMDEDGFLYIVDRKKDVVLVSGFNVYPVEIEDVVASLEGVRECACIGVPDDKTGEAVKLFVVEKNGAELSADDVQQYCRKNLTAYKVPKQIVFIDEIPKSDVGKILRRKLRELDVEPVT